MDLATKYRPKTFDEVIGQDATVAILKKWLKNKSVPPTIMFTGPSGCGKTTLARILASELKIDKCDLVEKNAADERGIDLAREIKIRSRAKALKSEYRAWILDEFHQATKDAQNAFLKLLEEPPTHVKFMICTTEPTKLLRTIQSRCTEVKCKSVNDTDMSALVSKIWKKEGGKASKDVVNRIIEVADGSPRKAIKILESVIGLDSEDQMLDAVQASESREFGFQLARCLIDTRKRYADASKILKDMEDEPETVRQIIMSYCASILLSDKHGGFQDKLKKRAAWIINCLREPIYSAPKQLLALAIYEVYHLS